MALKSTVKAVVEKKIEEYEGRYDHFYLDTKGKVTVGIGHLVANRQAVVSITMYSTKNGVATKAATLQEKQAEYDNVSKQKKNYKASWYKQHTTLIMKDMDIVKLRDSHINSFYKELGNIYRKTNGYQSDFDSLPEKVQMSLFDMIFNLGATKLQSVFVNFNKAIKAEKWDEAAKQSNRPDVSGKRNAYVKGLFMDVHNSTKLKRP